MYIKNVIYYVSYMTLYILCYDGIFRVSSVAFKTQAFLINKVAVACQMPVLSARCC